MRSVYAKPKRVAQGASTAGIFGPSDEAFWFAEGMAGEADRGRKPNQMWMLPGV